MLVLLFLGCTSLFVTSDARVREAVAEALEARHGEPFTVVSTRHSDAMPLLIPADRHQFVAHPTADPSMQFSGFLVIGGFMQERYVCARAKALLPRLEALPEVPGEKRIAQVDCIVGAGNQYTAKWRVRFELDPGVEAPSGLAAVQELADEVGLELDVR